MRRLAPAVAIALLFLAACAPQEGKTPETSTFLGGSQGLTLQFVQLRSEVFDGGNDPFDVVVRLENKGEWVVSAAKAKVRLAGINPSEFGKNPEDFALSPPDDLPAVTRESRSTPLDVEFRNLNYLAQVSGAALPPFPLVATACYSYGTEAVSRLCVRKDLLKDDIGLCTVEEPKTTADSGAPVHVVNFQEQRRGKDRVAFIFDVRHVGAGAVYELGSQCASRPMQNKVRVKVDTRIPGLSCSFATGSGTEGTVNLVDGVKTVTCTQPIQNLGDYEQPVNIELEYDYEDSITGQLTVKHAGE